MSSIGYRPEVDGLRAVSVLGVVLYHAGLGFPGGYVGVDVFFVISGFLITSIIHRGILAGTFSLKDFWSRRIRRILPAVTACVLVVLAAGAYVLEPVAYEDLAGAAAAQALMSSNVYFWWTTDYFAESADFQPLLHTWSLAVEEQFYLFFPFALVAVMRWARRWVGVLLAVAAVLSFAACLFGTQSYASATFFLLPTRAWELLLGALLAVHRERIRLPRAVSELAGAGGLAAIAVAFFVLDKATPFPGTAALLPVLGAAAFLVGTQAGPTFAGRLLSLRPLVFVGLISYSLYLWHWPVFAFSKHMFVERSTAHLLVLIVLSFVLAVASWRLVETPFRRGNLLSERRVAYRFGLATTAIVAVAAGALKWADGVPARFGPETLVLAADIEWNGPEGLVEGAAVNPVGREPVTGSAPDFVVWGDSHARMLAELVDQRAEAFGLAGELHLTNGVVPVTGLWRASWTPEKRARILEQNEAILASVLERRVPHLVLISRWANNCAGRNAVEVAAGSRPTETLVTDDPGRGESELDPTAASASLARQLQHMLDRLEAAGTRVWVIAQVPETDDRDTARHVYIAERFGAWNRFDAHTTTRAEHDARQAAVVAAFAAIDSPALTILDPSAPLFENEEGRLRVLDGRALYRDDNHLTRAGVERLAAPVFDRLFGELRSASE